jgi:hypothetical protein
MPHFSKTTIYYITGGIVALAIYLGIYIFGMVNILGLILLFFIFCIIYISPTWAVIALIIFFSFLSLNTTYMISSTTYSKIVTGIAILKFCSEYFKKNQFEIHKMDIILIFFGLWVGLSGIMNSSNFLDGNGPIRLLSFLVLYLLVSRFIQSYADITKIFSTVAIFGLILVVFNILEYIARANNIIDTYGKNTLAGQLAVLAIISIYFFNSYPQNTKKLFYLLLFGIYFTGVLVNSSRGALISLAIAILIFFLLQRFSWKMLLGIAFTAPIGLYSSKFLPVIGYTHSLSRLQNSLIGQDSRYLIWNANINIFLTNAMWGVGYGKITTAMNNYATLNIINRLIGTSTSQSMYLSTLTETGVIGLILFISSIIFLIIKIFKVRFDALMNGEKELFLLTNILIAILAVYLVEGVVADVHLWEYFWIQIGIMQGLVSLPSKKLFIANKNIIGKI